MNLTPAMRKELCIIGERGIPSDPDDWHHAGPLWFHTRDWVLGALERRGLITDAAGDFKLTELGRRALDSLRVSA